MQPKTLLLRIESRSCARFDLYINDCDSNARAFMHNLAPHRNLIGPAWQIEIRRSPAVRITCQCSSSRDNRDFGA